MTLIYLSGAWVAGIGLGFVLDLPLALVVTGLAPLPLLFFGRHRKAVILASLCLFIFFGGAVQSRSGLQDSDDLSFYNETGTIAVTGMVSEDPDVRDRTTRLRLSAREIKLDGEWREVTGTALLFVPRYPAYSYGDVLLVNGQLQTPPVGRRSTDGLPSCRTVAERSSPSGTGSETRRRLAS